jgi:hypothetical protein
MSSSFWSAVTEAPKDPILGISEAFRADPDPIKMNLGVGAYRDDDGKPVVLKSVREAEKRIAGNFNMEYSPIGGSAEFCEHSIKMAYGDDAACIKEGRVASVQSLSGTGSVRLMADFMARFRPGAKIYITKPTWSNHHNIFADARVEEKVLFTLALFVGTVFRRAFSVVAIFLDCEMINGGTHFFPFPPTPTVRYYRPSATTTPRPRVWTSRV